MSSTFRRKIYGTLGEMLKKLRQERNVTIADIALHADLSVETIQQLESGSEKEYVQYKRLLRYYGKTFDLILKNIDR